jgi:hypothetical protein
MLLGIAIYIKVENFRHLTLVGLDLQLTEDHYSEIQHGILCINTARKTRMLFQVQEVIEFGDLL